VPEDFDIWLEPGRTEKGYWQDIWRHRELFEVLAWRDIAVRYKQTSAGVAWALFQPIMTLVIMIVIFGKAAGLPSEGRAPYALMVFAGMLPWQFFASSLASSSQSLVGSSNLISKVYFPRVIVPVSAIVVACVDLLFSLAVLAAAMLWYRFVPGWRILTLPCFVLLAFAAALGPGLFLSALMVKYRDLRFVIPFIIQSGMYLSPVAYSSSLIRHKFGEFAFILYSLNPMVGVIDGFRWAILGGESNLWFPGFALVLSLLFSLLGVLCFRRREKTFADVI